MGSDGVDQWGDGEQKALNTTCNERKYIAENDDNRQRKSMRRRGEKEKGNRRKTSAGNHGSMAGGGKGWTART